MSVRFCGSMVALVTPFGEDKSVDWEGLERLVQRQLDGGTRALIICGTTGEASTMTPAEQLSVLTAVIKQVKGRIPVVAGTGSTSTRRSVETSLAAKEAGADALLVVTPPYNKPPQEGLIDYYTTITREVQHPVILYNVPGRTCTDMLPETVARLAEDPFIVAIKDATASMVVASRIRELCGDQLTLLSGDDFTAFPQLSVGGEGWISVTANLVPGELSAMYDAWQEGEISSARALHYKLLPLHRMLFSESNPIPAKAALHMMGVIDPHVRSPLVPLNETSLLEVRKALVDYGLLGGQG